MNNLLEKSRTTSQRPQSLEDICGNFMGYYVTKSGKVISKIKQKFVEPRYRNGIPFITLSENGVTSTYRLDQVVFRAFNFWYAINSRNIIHKDGDEGNCKIRNLSIDL
jgi:hypothetical protein